jgi:single-strand DNA-binding protein
VNNLNSILIEGNLTSDPEMKALSIGIYVCTFSVAVNRSYKGANGWENEVSYFDVETWAKLAEHCGNIGRKGRGVRVVGRLKQERWTDAEGKPRSKVKIVAEHVEFRPETKHQDSQPTQEQDAHSGDDFQEDDIPVF